MIQEKNLEGIGGWLILVAIGIVLGPVRIVILLLTIYPQIFSTGAWESLTTPGSDAYDPLWAPIIIGELLINITILLASLYLAYKFFTKSKSFPKWYIGIVIFSFLFIIADAYIVKLVLPDEPVFDPDTARGLVRLLISIVIWIPYMLVSKRVKATFVR